MPRAIASSLAAHSVLFGRDRTPYPQPITHPHPANTTHYYQLVWRVNTSR